MRENLEQNKIEQFLTSAPFIRSFEVLDTYQRLLEEKKNDGEKHSLIKERFRKQFDRDRTKEDVNPDSYSAKADKIREQIFSLCETNSLTKEKLALAYVNSPLGDKILESYQPKIGSVSETGHQIVNEAVEYIVAKHRNSININIIPTPIKGTEQLLAKVLHGFQKIAQDLKSESLQHIKKVEMVSWLLAPAFANKIETIFGKDIKPMDVDDFFKDSVPEIQILALSYNTRAVKEYLLTGNLPEVKKITMTKEEFINRFLK